MICLNISYAENYNPQVNDDGFASLYTLELHDFVFQKDNQYAVYSGPGEDYLRGANGKACVSTNEPVRVFGIENEWIMIEYAVDSKHHRIGWIQDKKLKIETLVGELPKCYCSATLKKDAIITDDPFYSKAILKKFSMNIEVDVLARLDEWIYIESNSGDLIRGFVHKSQLTLGEVFDLYQWSNDSIVLHGQIIIDRESIFVDIEPVLYKDKKPVSISYISVFDNITNKLLFVVSEFNEKNHLVGMGYITQFTSSLRIVVVDSNMKEIKSEKNFVIEW